jgi:hypothetical protein
MKKMFVGVAMAAMFASMASVAPALAAGAGVAAGAAAGTAAGAALPIAAADATRLKMWITDQKTASIAAPAGFTVAVGAAVPATVMTRRIAVAPAITIVDPAKYEYAVIGDTIVLVQVSDRKIVYAICEDENRCQSH